MRTINGCSISRVLFTGAPLSGKTTSLVKLKTRVVENSSVGVAFIPEAATFLLNHTEYNPIVNPSTFQEIVSYLYLKWSEEAELKVSEHYDKGIIIQDRGTTDAFVYPHNSNLISNDLNASLKRYDYVFFFESLYPQIMDIKAGNEHRVEASYDQIKEIETRAFEVYSKHNGFIFVPNNLDIDERTNFLAVKLNLIMGEKAFKTTCELTSY